MLDYLIVNATIVDGSGSPARVGDVGISGGRITAVGTIDENAAETIDATGLLLTPGFVDPHTHYDAQLLWDPFASPSNTHGVTTVISGNCGFTLAPLKSEDADWTLRMMAQVEGMPLAALREGVGGGWTSFGEYLDHLDGKLGVNAGFLVGHCALRRYVMGEDATGEEASAEQVATMKRELGQAIEAGGLGFSSTQSFSHDDGEGNPVPSRWATTEELLALAEVVSEHPGTTLEYITDGCLKGFTDEEIDRIGELSLTGKRPVNWNVLTVDSRERDAVEHQLFASERAEQLGGRVVALTMPILVPMNMSFLTRCALTLIPGWDEILTLPVPERMEKFRDPEVRARMVEQINSESAGVFRRFADFAAYRIGDTYSDETRRYEDRMVGDIAVEQGRSPFDTLVDIVLADELQTVLWPRPLEDDDESWQLRMDLIDSGRALIGGSDGGAHLDRMIGTIYPTVFLADVLRGHRLISLERAVQAMTDQPARLFGLRERGRIEPGWHADLVLFDPDTIGSENVRKVADMPAQSERLFARPSGVKRVWVNGRVTVRDNETTGDLAGALLRSGRDTETVEIPAGR